MNENLLIELLELLEETYPTDYEVNHLTKKLSVPINGEFSKIVGYLSESKKITVDKDPKRDRLQQGDRITITVDGIDFLTQKKLIQTSEKRNNIMKLATALIAISSIINSVIFIFREVVLL